ncbi:unnamed protein product [Candidula unifasciata]|uniref:JmjC domain-containing protein n=1 Tax=Candidula unifasciata TaxID=100452 RepID=A0A8S3YJ08_9EUPU|nr:unnamed protein product [Candidula unifasciata]
MASSICLLLIGNLVLNFIVPCLTTVSFVDLRDILNSSTSHCSVVFPETALTDRVQQFLRTLADVSFANESTVSFGKLREVPQNWPDGRPLHIQGIVAPEELINTVLIFKRSRQDRSCLLVPDDNFISPPVVAFRLPSQEVQEEFDQTLHRLTEFINGNCGTFRNADGFVNLKGIHRKDILDNLFSTSKSSSADKSLKKCMDASKIINMCMLNDNTISESSTPITIQTHNKYLDSGNNMEECERIEVPKTSNFFHEYLSRSKPVIITGAARHWPAFQKWTNAFLKQNYGDRKVHIKITPDGQYEGVEPISLWKNHQNFSIPESVYRKLPYPDLVVVRPASMEIRFSEFIDFIENISLGLVKNMSAYLEYSSITNYFPELIEDIEEMPFFRNVLELKHLNIWLSDGNTLGKLHFDPFDNFLCQISGEKQVLLFDPHDNSRLYEGHIQEAMLTYNASENVFSREKLLESTSMVMSPVDLLHPDLQRFPKFSQVRPLNCTIQAGDVLFMPSFWWHEVQSRPSSLEHRNLAVNFWYEPFLAREFPCQECGLDVNSRYFHLL